MLDCRCWIIVYVTLGKVSVPTLWRGHVLQSVQLFFAPLHSFVQPDLTKRGVYRELPPGECDVIYIFRYVLIERW